MRRGVLYFRLSRLHYTGAPVLGRAPRNIFASHGDWKPPPKRPLKPTVQAGGEGGSTVFRGGFIHSRLGAIWLGLQAHWAV